MVWNGGPTKGVDIAFSSYKDCKKKNDLYRNQCAWKDFGTALRQCRDWPECRGVLESEGRFHARLTDGKA